MSRKNKAYKVKPVNEYFYKSEGKDLKQISQRNSDLKNRNKVNKNKHFNKK